MALVPGSKEWVKRVADLIVEEVDGTERWFYMSFADEHTFRGGVFIKAKGPTSAVMLSHQNGLNPGGEVLTVEVPASTVVPEAYTNRLLSRSEMESLEKLMSPSSLTVN